MIGHSPYAPTSPFAPEPTGICDRCGFLYHLSALKEQMQWAGTSVVGMGIMVCPRDLDVLQQNGRRIIAFGPDPKPLKNARPSVAQAVQFVDDGNGEFTHEFDDEEFHV